MAWTARCRDADREKGGASWCQVGLPAQSLPRRRFRRALRAFICTFCMCVCIYVYVCMCADMIYVYICMCVCICTSMCLYTCVCVCVCIFVHRLWVLVSVLQRVDGVMHAHVFSCAYACVYICVYVYIYVHFFCSECYMHFTGVVVTSAWAGVYVTQVCFYTNVHICNTLAASCAHMCICIYVCICMYMHMDAYVRL